MRVLLDTHTVLWAIDDPSRLTPIAAQTLQDPANDLIISAATVWEIAIKVAIGKLVLSGPFRAWMTKAIHDLEATLLPITVEYADFLLTLPYHHRDPFDRLMVAQALTETISIVSADAVLDSYGVNRLW